MATFTLTINTDNAAFEENDYEIADLLGNVARTIRNNVDGGFLGAGGRIRDTNGNTVGKFELSED